MARGIKNEMATEQEIASTIKGWLLDALKYGDAVMMADTYATIKIALREAVESVFDDYEEDLIKANEE